MRLPFFFHFLSLVLSETPPQLNTEYSSAFSVFSPYLTPLFEFPSFNFGNSVIIDSNESIILTPDIPNQSGYLWSTKQFTWENWMFELQFRISGQSKQVFGDGFGWFFVKEPYNPGTCFGADEKFTGFALFFDTYCNSKDNPKFPQIQLAIGDGGNKISQYRHELDGGDIVVGRKNINFRNMRSPTKVRVTYISQNLEVYVDSESDGNWSRVFRYERLVLPKEGLHVGMSAYTGQAKDMHEIISQVAAEVILDRDFYGGSMSIQDETTTQPNWIIWAAFVTIILGVLYFVMKKRSSSTKYTGLYEKIVDKK